MFNFASRDSNKLAKTTGGDHYKPKLKKTMKPRKDHIHNVNLGKLPMNAGASFTTNKMIGNNNGVDRSTFQTMKMAKRQVGRHRVSIASR
jgi:hypothetical protein